MKLLCVVLLLGCVAVCCLGDTELVCGPLQKIKVWRQWGRAFGEGSHRLKFAISFWKKFLKGDPKLRELFAPFGSHNIYSPKFLAFTQRVFASFSPQLEVLDEKDTRGAIMAAAKAFYDDLKVPIESYEKFDETLVEVLREELGRHFDFDAWKACLHQLNVEFEAVYEKSS